MSLSTSNSSCPKVALPALSAIKNKKHDIQLKILSGLGEKIFPKLLLCDLSIEDKVALKSNILQLINLDFFNYENLIDLVIRICLSNYDDLLSIIEESKKQELLKIVKSSHLPISSNELSLLHITLKNRTPRIKMFEKLLSLGSSTSNIDSYTGKTELQQALMIDPPDNFPVVFLLILDAHLKNGADINEYSNLPSPHSSLKYIKQTVLHMAIESQLEKHVYILLKKGASCEVDDRNSNQVQLPPLHYCILCGNQQILNLIIDSDKTIDLNQKVNKHYGVIINEKQEPIAVKGVTPLMLATLMHRVSMVSYLLEKGAHKEVNIQDAKGNTATHHLFLNEIIFIEKVLPILKCLLDAGSNMNILNHDKQTPEDLLLLYKKDELIIYYLARTSSLSEKDSCLIIQKMKQYIEKKKKKSRKKTTDSGYKSILLSLRMDVFQVIYSVNGLINQNHVLNCIIKRFSLDQSFQSAFLTFQKQAAAKKIQDMVRNNKRLSRRIIR